MRTVLRFGATSVLLILCGTSALFAGSPQAQAQENTPAAVAQWNMLADAYLTNVLFKFKPTDATSAGLHEYDALLEDYSRSGIAAEIQQLHAYEKQLLAFDAHRLPALEPGDYALVLGAVRSRLLTLETIRPWEKNPDTYSGGVTNSIYVIMNRRFASSDVRLQSVIAREKQIPAVFAAARRNLKNPPRIFTEIALEQLPDLISFFQKDVPAAFADTHDAAIQAAFAASNAAVITALQEYERWLRSELLPRSHGDFRLGAKVFSEKLLYDEMVDTPLDRLLAIGLADLHRNQAEFIRLAKEVDPQKTPREVLEQLGATHPAPAQLIPTFTKTFAGLIAFIHDHHILTIPSDVQPIVEETPPFDRATTTASMDTPGPFEKVATEAYFNVTLPDPHDTPAQVDSFMSMFNRGTIVSTAVHETYPGHYIQFLWTPAAPSKIRKLLGAATNSEGWAHYCEQMMLDEGYGQPGVGAANINESRLIRLGQLQDALLRNARFIVGIQMHTGKMAYADAVKFFEKEGYQFHENSVIEAKRGTSDATYLYYTLGKIQILKLRADLQKKQGASFSLEKFHNDFLAQGFPPVKIVRQALLGDASPTL